MGIKISILAVFLFTLSIFAMPTMPYAQDATANKEMFNSSGLPIPRFISLRSSKVFVRTGPALRYPIKWIFVRSGMPVEIIQEFDTWRKIRDISGDEGWIHQSLLSGKRTAIVNVEEGATLYRKPQANAKAMAKLEKGVQVTLEACKGAWCQVEANDFSGWTQRKSLWGVYDTEEFD